MVAFSTPHRGGHKLWDLSGSYGSVRADEREEFSHALRDIYVECDRCVGQLTDAASNDANLLVFSLHGMTSNTNRNYLLPKILSHILDSKPKYSQESNRGYSSFKTRIRKHVPYAWLSMAFPPYSSAYGALYFCRSKLGNNVPRIVAAAAFSIDTADQNGYIRINLCGREKNGIVEPGEEYDKLCSAITKDLRTFVDAATGQPIVEKVVRSDELFKSGPRLKYLPDLIVLWAPSHSSNQQTIVSNRYPSISIPAPQRKLNGRSGNHKSDGFLIALGSGISHNSQIENGNILDLAPTIYALLGVRKPTQMRGNSLWATNKQI